MKQNQAQILKQFELFLWSFDLAKMDLKKIKKRIIANVLNFGSKEATDLLFKVYNRKDIKMQVQKPLPGEWSNKSLNYWSIVFDVNFKSTKNFLLYLR